MTLPDFLVLGAARAATTSLHYYLDQHPGITMSSIKEPNFFAFDHGRDPAVPMIDQASPIVIKSVSTLPAYEALFAHAGPGDLVGEASPLYLYAREAPAEIERFLGTARFVAVLRNPVDRAYSHWLHMNRTSAEQALVDFRAACEAEMAHGPAYSPYASGTHVLRMGLYDEQLARYVDRFGAESLLVLDYGTTTRDPQEALARVCDHVGASHHIFDTHVRYNRSGVSRGRVRAGLAAAVRWAQPTMKALFPPTATRRLGRIRAARDRPLEAPQIPGDLRARLVDWFAPSVGRLVDAGHLAPGTWQEFA